MTDSLKKLPFDLLPFVVDTTMHETCHSPDNRVSNGDSHDVAAAAADARGNGLHTIYAKKRRLSSGKEVIKCRLTYFPSPFVCFK